ncbi:MAG: GFA family protein [Roseobacter sp.]
MTGDVKSVSACHCGQCRRQSGGIWHSAIVERCDLQITGMLQWYRSSPTARRGFCPTCGAFLFWQNDSESSMSFALGALETPTGLTLQKHIFTADQGDYYTINENTAQKET